MTAVASIAKTKPECPVAMESYITNGTRLVQAVRWMAGSAEVMVEDVVSGKTEYLSAVAVKKHWRIVTPEPKADDGD